MLTEVEVTQETGGLKLRESPKIHPLCYNFTVHFKRWDADWKISYMWWGTKIRIRTLFVRLSLTPI